MIVKPQLPPKQGYVEVEFGGKHTYKNVATGILIDYEIPKPTSEERIADLESENALKTAQIEALTERNDFQEELIVELASVIYA